MQDLNLAAKLLLIEYQKGFVDTKANDLDQFVLSAVVKPSESEDAVIETLRPYRDAAEKVARCLDRLSAPFEHRDKLLTAQGHIPVYYWLARKNVAQTKRIREFLKVFTKEVSVNLEVSRDAPDNANPELSAY